MKTPPNNPLKLPFFLLCAAIGVFVAIVAVLAGTWWLAVLGVVLVSASLWPAHIVRQGRNPRWMRAQLDGRWPRQD